MKPACEGRLYPEIRLLASEMQPNFPKVIPTIRHIPPHAIDHKWNTGQLIEQTPWSEAEKKQRLFQDIALVHSLPMRSS